MRTLLWVRRALFLVGACAFGYCVFFLGDEWAFQNREHRQFEEELLSQHAFHTDAPPIVMGGVIGRIDIPRLRLSVMIAEGTSDATLRRAAGHIAGMTLPGHTGNIGIAGHRDTFFRPLQNIKYGDEITITTLSGEFKYRVVSTKIVKPSDVSVLASSGVEAVTLITCYPFYFVGSAPDRFVVRAERVGAQALVASGV
jgi:sortase A